MSVNDEKIQATLAKYATGIDHVAIAVHDLEASIAFYTQVVGFELTERRETKGEHTAMNEMRRH